jgi:hypothetical protein
VTAVQLVVVCPVGCRVTQGCEHLLQEVSLQNAEAKGNPWSPEELEFLLDTTNEALSDVADALNRTYYAVSRARSLVKRGILKV